MRFDGNDVIRWGVAGICSVACHVAVILVVMWTGSSSTPPPPLEPSPLADVGLQDAPLAAPSPANSAAPSPANSAAEVPSAVSAPPLSAPASTAVKTRIYKVRPGDKLIHLARGCGSTPAEIAKLNGVDEKTMANLKVGQIIKLKAAE
jgi:cell envelope opacity-associated protein A